MLPLRGPSRHATQPRAFVRRHGPEPQSRTSSAASSRGRRTIVYVFSYPKGKLLGEIKWLELRYAAGPLLGLQRKDRFNAMNGNNGNTYEYEHGGKKLIADLVEPYLWVYGCSVDPTTGNLAVASVNLLSAASWVAVYVCEGHAQVTKRPRDHKLRLLRLR